LSIVVDSAAGPATRHGLRELRRSLQAQSVPFAEVNALTAAVGETLIVAGVSSSDAVTKLMREAGVAAPEGAESTLIRRTSWQGKDALLVSGGDDRGLMYALLDVAERIGWADDRGGPLSRVHEARERPYVAERSLSIYTMHKRSFLKRFHDIAYWATYLGMLARNRFNTFALLFAYESAGLFAPPYPYFFDVDGYPEVGVAGLTQQEQQRNLRSLNRLIAMVHERGLDFTLGIWDHIYRGGVQQGPGQDPENPLLWRVLGLSKDNLMDYSVAALTQLLRSVPNVDTLQFRMHGESGLTDTEMDKFWARIYDVMAQHGRGIRFDARAKGFPDRLIDLAIEKGIDIRICTKYWMEQMGLPFHPTHVHPRNQMDRRHGYADLLRHPQRYKMLWRLWNGGTARVLLWGDPEYVRRFAHTTHLYDGEGFDVNEPLATLMASHDHDLEPVELHAPAYRHYRWEFERHWHFFQVFGRLGYNPDTPPEIWEEEFKRRFGPSAPHVMRGLHLASRILPRIVAYNYPYHLFPTTRGWVGKQRMGSLPEYAAALPSDTEQFLSMDEAALNRAEGRQSCKIHPLATGAWFERTGNDVLAYVAQAEALAGDAASAELRSTLVDLRILAHLALYHSRRIPAGLWWALFRRCGDLHACNEAIRNERRAIEAWTGLVDAAGDVYARDLMMGRERAGLSGHWRDELVALEDGLRALQAERACYHPTCQGGAPHIAHVPVRKAIPSLDLVLWATVHADTPLSHVRIGYGHHAGVYAYAEMQQCEAHLYRGTILAEQVVPGLRYYIDAVDSVGQRALYPDGGADDPIAVIVSEDDQPPSVVHERIATAPAGMPLTISAQVSDLSGVKWVRLRYRSVTQFQDFCSLEMRPTGTQNEYVATVPGEHVDPQWDLMYLIEAMDTCGNGARFPDLEVEAPYVVVRLERES
jgi:hypothetical protein